MAKLAKHVRGRQKAIGSSVMERCISPFSATVLTEFLGTTRLFDWGPALEVEAQLAGKGDDLGLIDRNGSFV